MQEFRVGDKAANNSKCTIMVIPWILQEHSFHFHALDAFSLSFTAEEIVEK